MKFHNTLRGPGVEKSFSWQISTKESRGNLFRTHDGPRLVAAEIPNASKPTEKNINNFLCRTGGSSLHQPERERERKEETLRKNGVATNVEKCCESLIGIINSPLYEHRYWTELRTEMLLNSWFGWKSSKFGNTPE